jgi:hypothetical protein
VLMTRRYDRMLRPRIAGALLLALVAASPLATKGPEWTRALAAPPAWADDLSPIAPADGSHERAAHLVERAGFGAAPDEVAHLAARTPRRVVDELVDYESFKNDVEPFDESGIWNPGVDPFPPSRAEAVGLVRECGEGCGEKVLLVAASL